MNNLYNLNLKNLDTSSAVITGTEMALTNQENGKIYTTTKPYMDKLFSLMGYKSTYVVKILEEYAGKTLTSIGSLNKGEGIWIDDGSDTFIVTTSSAISWVNSLFDYLKDNGFKIIDARRLDTTYYWDQIVIESEKSGRFAIYIDLCEEYVGLYHISVDTNGVVCNIEDQSIFKFEEDGSFNDMISALNYPGIDSPIDPSCVLSIDEFINLCKTLGLVRTKRKMLCPVEGYDKLIDLSLETICDSYNKRKRCTWINHSQ